MSNQNYIITLNDVQELTYDTDSLKVNIPQPKSDKIKIVGSNAKAIIDLNGNVYEPLEKKAVKITLKLGDDELKEFIIDVEGKYQDNGINKKPTVIPALAEWHGLEGSFTFNNEISITTLDDKFKDAVEIFIVDLKELDIHLSNSDNEKNAIIFKYDNKSGLGEEGYAITVEDNKVIIYAEHHTGAFYATRSLHQILKSSQVHQIPNGYIRDYPKYPIRGFMLDIGRKFTKLDYLYDIMKTMSYYKMNDFQVHLNDNSFLEFYEDAEEGLKKGYPGFRLESDLEGNDNTLTSTDGFYTKAEFTKLITDSAKYGITIVPEFDTPGHALSFVKIRPDLMFKGEILNDKVDQERAAMLDLENEETVPFIKSMYNEFLDGDNPVIGDVPVHIGCDEYYGEAEVYRGYVDELLKFIRDDKKRTPRVWGSLTNKTGDTPITAEGVQLQAWNTNWSEPNEMIELGYDIINIEDHQVYIVPGAEYYFDYLEAENLYNNFEPNKFLNGAVVNESHPQLLGGAFALWNDKTGFLENGITSYDMFDRIFDALPVLAQKNWNTDANLTYQEFKDVSKMTGYAPGTNPRFTVPSESKNIFKYDFTKATTDLSDNKYNPIKENNVIFGNGIIFNGKDSYLEMPLNQIGPNAELTIEVELNQTNRKQVLVETDNAAKIYAVDGYGYIGYEYENNTYSFNYKLKPDEKTVLRFVTSKHETKLFVNDTEVKLTRYTMKKFNTLVLPLKRIGALENSFDGYLTRLELKLTK